jgi:hypothetical protein
MVAILAAWRPGDHGSTGTGRYLIPSVTLCYRHPADFGMFCYPIGYPKMLVLRLMPMNIGFLRFR